MPRRFVWGRFEEQSGCEVAWAAAGVDGEWDWGDARVIEVGGGAMTSSLQLVVRALVMRTF